MPPRTRISEAPQRITARDGHQQRRVSSDSDPLHCRPITERTPRLMGDRRSPKGSQSDPLNQRKLGTRISDLESQLIEAQRELKNLKQQLSSGKDQNPEETHKETDVFEVPMEKVSIGSITELVDPKETTKLEEKENLSMDQTDSKKSEMEELKAKLEAKDKELEEACEENENLKKQVYEVNSEISATRVKLDEMTLKYTKLEKEVEASNETKSELMKKLETMESAKEEVEGEMMKLRVQTEQWRKAADAAASVLAGEGVEVSGGRVSERCGSMEKHFNSVFEPPLIGGYPPGYLDDDLDDAFGNGKRKGSGIRMFGDLWKKKGHK